MNIVLLPPQQGAEISAATTIHVSKLYNCVSWLLKKCCTSMNRWYYACPYILHYKRKRVKCTLYENSLFIFLVILSIFLYYVWFNIFVLSYFGTNLPLKIGKKWSTFKFKYFYFKTHWFKVEFFGSYFLSSSSQYLKKLRKY